MRLAMVVLIVLASVSRPDAQIVGPPVPGLAPEGPGIYWVFFFYDPAHGFLASYPFTNRSMCESASQATYAVAVRYYPGSAIGPCVRIETDLEAWWYTPQDSDATE